MNSRPKSLASNNQLRLLFMVMVIVGYIITIVLRSNQGKEELSLEELILGIALGVVYLLVGLNSHRIYDRLPGRWVSVLFFSVQWVLIFGIGLVMGTGGTWLVGIPLAGFAVEMLEPRQRWAVYVALIAALILPIGLRFGSWVGALINSVTFASVVFFVAVFAQLRLNEQQARERTEHLMVELKQANIQLAAYATQAEEFAMTQERNRLAREIHDTLGHYLTIVNVQIEAARVVMDTDPPRAMEASRKAQELTQKGLTRVRESVGVLRESPVIGSHFMLVVQEKSSLINSNIPAYYRCIIKHKLGNLSQSLFRFR